MNYVFEIFCLSCFSWLHGHELCLRDILPLLFLLTARSRITSSRYFASCFSWLQGHELRLRDILHLLFLLTARSRITSSRYFASLVSLDCKVMNYVLEIFCTSCFSWLQGHELRLRDILPLLFLLTARSWITSSRYFHNFSSILLKLLTVLRLTLIGLSPLLCFGSCNKCT
jgi:hypothetical protein